MLNNFDVYGGDKYKFGSVFHFFINISNSLGFFAFKCWLRNQLDLEENTRFERNIRESVTKKNKSFLTFHKTRNDFEIQISETFSLSQPNKIQTHTHTKSILIFFRFYCQLGASQYMLTNWKNNSNFGKFWNDKFQKISISSTWVYLSLDN